MTTGTDLPLDSIGQISIPAKDLAQSLAFYRDRLGVKFLFEAPPDMAFFQCGDLRLLIGRTEGEHVSAASIIYFRVADIDSAHATLRERGVEFRAEPHLAHKAGDRELWLAFFADPAGNTLALMCEKSRS